MQRFRPIEVMGPLRTREHGDVARNFLPGGAVRQHLEHDGQIRQAGNNLFHAHERHVHAWHGGGETAIALIGHQDNRTRFGNREVHPGDAHISP